MASSRLPAPWNEARPGRPLVVSHRAGGNEAPENTLAALRSAEAAGSKVPVEAAAIASRPELHLVIWASEADAPCYQVMQMDILPTSEGTPVIFHDTSLLRACGVDADIRQVAGHASACIQFLSPGFYPLPEHTDLQPYAQVAAKDLPPYREVLQPLIPTRSAVPLHTTDYLDGRRIPDLKELLMEANTHRMYTT